MLEKGLEILKYHVAFDLVDTDFLLPGINFNLFKLLNPTFPFRRFVAVNCGLATLMISSENDTPLVIKVPPFCIT